MSTTLVVRFDLGRYHATPWGRHVNEGQVELPPSPWRLLRALYAVWQTRVPDLDAAVVHRLLGRLAEPPCYFVPPHRLAHTRHYYPDTKHRTGTPSTDLTLDAFAAFPPGAELAIRWPFDLLDDEHKALRRLAESLPYLGRADSLCQARVDDDWAPSSDHTACGPLDVGESIPAPVQTVTLLAPSLPLDLTALVLRPVEVRAGKLLFPHATRFVAYPRPPERPPRPAAPRRPRRSTRTEAIRYTITARVLPPETDAVALTDRLRNAAVNKLNRLRGNQHHDSLLAGRHADGTVRTGHQHAHYLALGDRNRRIAELAIWAPGGLDDEELIAAANITRLFGPDGMPGPGPLEIRMAAYGQASDILADLRGPATRWRSRTPFVPPRHPKTDWPTFIDHETRRELHHHQLPEPVSVRLLTDTQDHDWRAFLRYRPSRRFTTRQPGHLGTSPPGAFVEITFPTPVTGPLTLGHLSHFGLGLFEPA